MYATREGQTSETDMEMDYLMVTWLQLESCEVNEMAGPRNIGILLQIE